MWGASLVLDALENQFPGPGMTYLGQTLQFIHPMSIADTLTITLTVLNKVLLSLQKQELSFPF
jgi:acyl dehydratase